MIAAEYAGTMCRLRSAPKRAQLKLECRAQMARTADTDLSLFFLLIEWAKKLFASKELPNDSMSSEVMKKRPLQQPD